MKELKNIWRLSKGGRRSYMFAVISVVMATLFVYAVPIMIQFTIDTVLGGKESTSLMKPVFEWFMSVFGNREYLVKNLWICGITLVFLTAGQSIFMFLKGRMASIASENAARNLRNRLYNQLQRVPFSYHNRADTGDIIQRCTSDVETVRLFLQMQSIDSIRVIVMIVTVLPIMFMYNVSMAIAASCLLPLIMAYSGLYFFRMRKIHRQVAESEARMSTVLQENLTGVRVVKAFSRQQFEMDKFDEKNSYLRNKSFEMMDIVSNYWAISALFCMAQIGIVLVYGIVMASRGTLTIGEFQLFMSYSVTLVWTIRGMGRIVGEMGRAMVSFSRIGEVLDEKVEGEGEEGITPQVKGEIEFKNVSFSYGENEKVLDGLSLKIPAGKTVAFVGPTGSGKSSLVNLLPRLYDCREGDIFLDGQNIKEFDRQWLRQNIGVVLQEPFLFSVSIEDNILSGNVEASREDAETAAAIACVHDGIMEFSAGYETMVGERGVTLSGGQKQRLAIARAVVKEHPVLIFDDSLSAVDAETDFYIRKELAAVCGKVTTIIVSHRMTTVADADIIYVLEEGKISQSGTHQKLLDEGGLYSRLWKIQQQMEEVS